MTIVFREPPTAIDNVRMGGINRIILGLGFLLVGQKHEAIRQFQTGLDRIRDTGDYTPGGQFDSIYPGWRDCEASHRQVAWRRAVSAPDAVDRANYR